MDRRGLEEEEQELFREQLLETQREWLLVEARRRDRLLRTVPQGTLLLLAVAPHWSLSLARGTGLPEDDPDVEETLRRLVAGGVCRFEPSGDDGGEEVVWMPDQQRRDALKRVLSDEGGAESVRKMLVRAGARLLRGARAGRWVLPASMERWAALAERAESRDEVAKHLDDQIRRLVDEPEKARVYRVAGPEPPPVAVGEALHWIEAAERLEEVLGGTVSAAVGRAQRKVQIVRLRHEDERRLRSFLERAEQIRAFDALLSTGVNGPYALHYIGLGGVGKTMLLRHLFAREIPRRNLATARVDFDHIAPDYPARKPWLLLEQLAEQLRLAAASSLAVRELANFNRLLLEAKEAVASSPGALGADAIGDRWPGLIRAFARFLASLPPVVLMLDTCEELAKAHLGEGAPENVEAMFSLIEALHAFVRDLRVVLCGRRPLAAGGAGWRWIGVPTALPRRDYLLLHEVRGFAEDEARRYLRVAYRGAKYASRIERPGLVGAILERSEDARPLARIAWDQGERAPADPAELRRYLPLELGLYAAWVREDCDVSAEQVRTVGADHLVQSRILARLEDPVVHRLLPAVALAGVFDREMLAAATPVAAGDLERCFGVLLRQEWVGPSGAMYAAEPSLARRLRAYFEKQAPEAVLLARRALREHLARRTAEAPLDELAVDHFAICAELFAADEAPAVGYLRAVEARFAREGRYEWAYHLSGRLLALEARPFADLREASDGGAPNRLGATVLALHAAALLHRSPAEDRSRVWQSAARLGRGDALLELRCAAGQVAAARSSADALAAGAVDALWSALRGLDPAGELCTEQVVAAFVAALEWLVEHAERAVAQGAAGRALELVADVDSLDHLERVALDPRWGGDLRAFAASLLGRALRLRSLHDRALAMMERALSLADEALAAPAQRFLDLLTPADLWARVRLELVRLAYPAQLGPSEVLARVEGVSPVLAQIMARVRGVSSALAVDRPARAAARLERAQLEAAEATLRAAMEVPSALHEHAGDDAPYVVEFLEASPPNALHEFPPLPVVAAEILADRGEVEAALERIEAIVKQRESRSQRLDIARAADRVRRRAGMRMRLLDEGMIPRPDLHPDGPGATVEDLAIAWALEGVSAEGRVLEELTTEGSYAKLTFPGELHARFRASPLADHPVEVIEMLDVHPLAGSVGGLDGPVDPDFHSASRFLDGIELGLLAARYLVEPGAPPPASPIALAAPWPQIFARAPVEAITLLLRAGALGGDVDAFAGPLASFIARAGVRRAAAIALEEGDLLALRLPDLAFPLLDRAHDLFVEAGDALGAFLATAASALARARTGGGPLREGVERLEGAYGRVRSTLSVPLPSWDELQAVAGEPSGERLDRLSPRAFRPWLVRVVVCLAFDRGTLEQGKTLFDWVALRYGRRSRSGRVSLPPDLEGAILAFQQSGRLDEGPPTQPRPMEMPDSSEFQELSRDLDPPGDMSESLADLLDTSRSIGVSALEESNARMNTLVRLNRFERVLRGADIQEGLTAGANPLSQHEDALARLRGISEVPPAEPSLLLIVEIQAGPPAKWWKRPRSRDELAPFPVVLQWRQGDGALGDVLEIEGTHENSPREVSPREASSRLFTSAAARRFFERLRGAVQDDARVEIRLDPGLADVCWEAILGIALFGEEGARISRTLFWRSALEGKATLSSGRWHPIGTARAWTSSTSQSELAGRVWDAPGAPYAWGLYEEFYGSSWDGVEAAHFIAACVSTPRGTRLQAADEGSYDIDRSPRAFSSRGRAYLLEPFDLRRRLPDVRLCVLQAVPTPVFVRGTDDREQAENLRSFGRDLLELGIPAVITVPPLPEQVAERALQALASGLAASESAPDLLRLLATMRRVVFLEYWGGRSERRDDALDAAMDVCFHAWPEIAAPPQSA
ncbi:hypothetical protein [Sorangium sp. So ce1099]|uniref:hypothetical protein n=1 Tax=Sorangium sp. So ce1099 TaxID=3133331 RepID=UPI003F615758